MDASTFSQLKESNYHHPVITEVMFDHHMMLEMDFHSMSIIEKGYDTIWDSNMINFNSKYFREGMAFVEKLVKEKGIRLRLIVEATKENIDFINSIRCQEIRCLDDLNGNFGIFDNRAYMVYIYHTKSDRLDQTLWSNSKTLVDKQQAIFNKLWEMALPLKLRTKELEREYISNYNKTFSSLEEARTEIRFLVEQSRKELLLFASKKLLNTIMTNDSFLDYFLPAIKRDIKIKILIDDIGEHLSDQIKSINDSKTNNLCKVGFTNQLGNVNEMVILSDNKYIIKVKYDPFNNLEATFSKEEHHVQVQETLFEKYWNEIKSLDEVMTNLS